jgi:acyl-homoserine lactone acylase PvdQ
MMKQLNHIGLVFANVGYLIGKYALSAIAWQFFPKSKGTLVVKGLKAEVHVYRDKWGVPHISAQNQGDLFFAQGYVHAQDRFWQDELLYSVLSKAVGEEQANTLLPFYPHTNRPVIAPTGKTDAEEVSTSTHSSPHERGESSHL